MLWKGGHNAEEISVDRLIGPDTCLLYTSGKGKGAAIGAAIGAAVGSGTGALIGRRMDKQKKELEAIQEAKVETVTDANNLQEMCIRDSKYTVFQGIY